MPDKRTHRGQHPLDKMLFAPSATAALKQAVADYSLLLTKGYAEKSSLKLVGDRFALTKRQRIAVMRNACSDQQLAIRKISMTPLQNIKNQQIAIDGYNLLITIESAIAKALIFKGRDNTFKDLASIHGTYKKVTETIPAINLIGNFLQKNQTTNALWLLDSPVSNSARLKTIIAQQAEKNNWNWEIKLLNNPDAELIKTQLIVATTDSVIIDKCKKWVNLAAEIIKKELTQTKIIDLSKID